MKNSNVYSVVFKTGDERHTLELGGKGTLATNGTSITFVGFDCQHFGRSKVKRSFGVGSITGISSYGRKVILEITEYDTEDTKECETCVCQFDSRRNVEEFISLIPWVRPCSSEILDSEPDQEEFAASLLQQTRVAFVTPLLLLINIAIFIIMAANGVDIFSPTSETLLNWGADHGLTTLSGEYWRMISNTFVHAGIIHLAFNMWVLYSVGGFVERIYGNVLFAVIYLFCAAFASVASLIRHPEIVSVGASGAIFGLYGALGAFLLCKKANIPKGSLLELRNSTLGFVGYNLLFGFTVPFIDNAAHIGGLVAGFCISFLAIRPFHSKARKRLLLPRLAATCIAGALFLGITSVFLPYEYGRFGNYLDKAVKEEERAFSQYNKLVTEWENSDISNRAFSAALEQKIIPYWDFIAVGASEIQLPAASFSSEQQDFLRKYGTLRRNSTLALISYVRSNDVKKLQQHRKLWDGAEKLAENGLDTDSE